MIIGAGHAGLAVSRFLTDRSVDHLVLERGEVANSWRRERWDSLRLLTPNWLSRLPGLQYEGPDPDGFMTAGVAAVAQNRGIQLRSVESNVEGSMDIRGILGIDSDVRNGYDDIKVTFKIDGDAPRKEIEAIVAQSQKRSAVYDIITNPTNVTVAVV